MAISPTEAQRRYLVAHSEGMIAAEAFIDKMLSSQLPDYAGRRIISVPKVGLERVQLGMLVDKYRSIGWKVSIISDQRDGDFLEFRE